MHGCVAPGQAANASRPPNSPNKQPASPPPASPCPCSPTPRLRQVDLALEKRVQRSRALRAALLELAPALEQLGARLGGGRDQQLLERLREL